MRELLILTKISLINGFNLHGFNPKNLKNKKELWKPIVFALVMVSLVPTYIFYLNFLNTLNEGFIMLNQGEYFLAFGYNAVSIIIFFFGLAYIMSYFYFSKETQVLLPLPIKQRTIIISKFNVILAYEYIITLIFILPFFITHGLNTDANILYYLMSLIYVILTPVAPLALSAVVMMLIMKFTNIKGKKDLLRVISMFAFLIIVLGLQLLIQRGLMNSMEPGQSEDYILQLLRDNELLLKRLGYTNPLAKWLGTSLISGNISKLLNFMLFIISNILFFILFVFVGEKVYLGGIIGGNEVVSAKKQLSSSEFDDKLSRKNKPYISIFKTDMTLLLKTPIYLLNCVSIVILIPFILILMPIMGGTLEGIDVIIDLYEPFIDYVNFGLAGAIILFGALNPTAATTFSREGKYFWLSRIVPVSSKDQIIGRSLSPMLLQGILTIIILVGMRFIVDLKISTILIALILGLTGSILVTLIGILIDIQRPLLNWTNPQRAVKQNLNVLISMVAGLAVTAGLGFLTFFMFKLKVDSMIITIINLVIIIIASLGLYKVLLSKIKSRFIEIEE